MAQTAQGLTSRSVSLEKDYVHEVYERIGRKLSYAEDPLQNTVHKFLDDLEPGSIIADVGCGDGRHLLNSNSCYAVGADCSLLQTKLTRGRGKEVILGTNLRLPFRTDFFDGVLNVGVIHHLASKDRRIEALKELTRILRVGGRILIAVRSQDSDHPKDVLMPWYDIKNKKDERWLDQDSGEYDLDHSDNDSISLPTSDEEDDHPAKFHPPMTSSWFSEGQTYSFDDDQQSSKSVPNNPITPINVYNYFRDTLRRLSSANSTDEDGSLKLKRVDSAIPPSPSSCHDTKLEFSDCYSVTLSESLQKLIHDNFIELLNIEEPNVPPFHQQFEINRHNTWKPLSSIKNETRGHSSFHPSKKNRLLRSLSDIFKNVPDLWSNKNVKSCSDLKSQASTSTDNSSSWKEKSNHLKRSRTTATCNSSFDAPPRQLVSIGEFPMTLSEADQIVNDFLCSSLSSIETLKNPETALEYEPNYGALSQSDITNGNIMPGCNSPVFDTKGLEREDIDFNFRNSGTFTGASGNLEHFFETQLSGTRIRKNEEEDSILQFQDSLLCDLEFSNAFDQEDVYGSQQRKESLKSHSDSLGKVSKKKHLENKASKTQREYSSIHNRHNGEQFSDLSVHTTILELPEDQKIAETSNEKTSFFQEQQSLGSTIECPLLRTNISDQAYIFVENADHSKPNEFDPKYDTQKYFSLDEIGSANQDSLKINRKTIDSSKNTSNDDLTILKHTIKQRTLKPKHILLPDLVEDLGSFKNVGIPLISQMETTLLTSHNSMPELHKISSFNSPIKNRTQSVTLKHNKMSKGIIQDKIMDRLQTSSSKSLNFEETEDIVILSRENKAKQQKFLAPPLRPKKVFGKYNTIKSCTDENIGERRSSIHATTDYNFELVEIQKCISSSSVNSPFSSKKDKLHKSHSKSLDTVANRQSRSIDAINDMLHFNCANCAKYDDMNYSKPLKSQFSHSINQKRSEDSISENDVEKYRNHNSNAEIFIESNGLMNLTINDKKEDRITEVDENAKYSVLENGKDMNVLERNKYYPSRVISEDIFAANEVAGTKRKYKLHECATSAPSTVEKQHKINSLKTEETRFQTWEDSTEEPKLTPFELWLFEESRSNPICQVGNHTMDTYHTRSSDYFKCDSKPLPTRGNSLDCDRESNELFHDVSGSNLPDPIKNVQTFESHKKSACDSVATKHISKAKSSTREFESVKSKHRSSRKGPGSRLSYGQHSLDAKSPTENPTSKEALESEKAEKFTDQETSNDIDESEMNVNSFYGRVLEEGTTVCMHRYHHLFEKDELANLIEENIDDLHVLDYFHEQSHWCLIAEKVRVWTI